MLEKLLNFIGTIPCDKLGHIVSGFVVFTILHFISTEVALFGVLLAAWGKEAYDYFHKDKHTPDAWDALATMLGGLTAFIAGL